MPNQAPKELLYDHMPRPDVKLPPVRDTLSPREDAKKLVPEPHTEEVTDFLSNLAFH